MAEVIMATLIVGDHSVYPAITTNIAATAAPVVVAVVEVKVVVG